MSKLAIICGGRDYGLRLDGNGNWKYPPEFINQVKEEITSRGITFVIEGGAKGADRLARLACEELGVDFIEVPALWKRRGQSAGYKRNALMLKVLTKLAGESECLVLAFPGGKGTKMMTTIAREAGVKVEEIDAAQEVVYEY